MALAIYKKPDPDTKVTETNPFTLTYDGRIGGAIDTRLYIRNDSSRFYYTDISVRVIDTVAPNFTNESIPKCYWKFAEKDVALSNAEWQLVQPANTLTITSAIGTSTLADTSLYLPFWVRVAFAPGFEIQTITNILLRVNATEKLVNV